MGLCYRGAPNFALRVGGHPARRVPCTPLRICSIVKSPAACLRSRGEPLCVHSPRLGAGPLHNWGVKRLKNLGDPSVAVAYLRVSTGEQALGLEAQRHAIQRWAEARSVAISSWHEDRGVSGGAPVERRPALAAALDAVSDHGAGLLLAHKRDRLARDVFIAAVVERLAQKQGAQVMVAEGGTNGDGPEAALMRAIIDAIAQYERAVIRGRIKAALAVKKRGGQRVGSIQYGKRLSADGVHLEDDPIEQVVIARVCALREQGCTYAEIAQDLVEAGYRPRSGRTWHAMTLSRIVSHGQSTAS